MAVTIKEEAQPVISNRLFSLVSKARPHEVRKSDDQKLEIHIRKTVARNMEAIKNDLNLTNREIADQCELSQAAVRDLSLGLRRADTLTLLKVSIGLEIPFLNLYEGVADYVSAD